MSAALADREAQIESGLSAGQTYPASVVPARVPSISNAVAANRWFGPVIVIFLFLGGVFLTWRKWPDPLVDFGSQLYIPWRIASGEILYRDIHYLTGGPLSQYYHALLFKVFPASLLTLVLSNLAILAGMLGCIYSNFRRCSDQWTATLICSAVLLVFSFNQLSDLGNYNYVTPYCHEIWHGLALSVLGVSLLARAISRSQSLPDQGFNLSTYQGDIGVGLCAGAIFLTKPDVFLAFAATLGAAFFLIFRAKTGGAFRSLAVCICSGLIVPFLFLIKFHTHETWSESVRSVCFAWVPLLSSHISSQPFYKWCLGLDAPGFHLRMMVFHFAVISTVLMACAFLFRQPLRTSVQRLFAIAVVAAVAALASGVDWSDSGRALPLLAASLLVILWTNRKIGSLSTEFSFSPVAGSAPRAARGGRSQRDRHHLFMWCSDDSFQQPSVSPTPSGQESPRFGNEARFDSFPLLWSVFALCLLAKLGFFSRIWHYGFVLAMPAFVSAIYLCHWALPRILTRFKVQSFPFRLAVTSLLAVGFLRLFIQSQHTYAGKSFGIAEGANRFYVANDPQRPPGSALQTAVDWMRRNTPANSTLAVLPEGVMINFLPERRNPTHYIVWNPAELAVFGQTKMTADFIASEPDYVMLVHRDGAEYGAKFFGQEKRFGKDLMNWIDQHYHPVLLIGNEPLKTSAVGIKILARTAS